MTENWEQQTQQMIEQGKQTAAGYISGGEMIIDADPEKGYFRVKIRDVQPAEATPQITMGFCVLLMNGAAMLNLQVKQHIESQGGRNNG
jgi:hypothetical protein